MTLVANACENHCYFLRREALTLTHYQFEHGTAVLFRTRILYTANWHCYFLKMSIFFYRYIFYRAVCTMVFACCVLDLLCHLFSLSRRLPELFRNTKFLVVMTFLGAVSLLATASLVLTVADVSSNERDALVASFCGFLTMIAFLLESFLYFLKIRSENLYMVD